MASFSLTVFFAAISVKAHTLPGTYYDFMHMTVRERPYTIFSAMAPAQAHIALTEVPGVTRYNAYVVLIGAQSNQETWIRKDEGGSIIASASTPNILDPDNPRTFWISWYDGLLEVGEGDQVGVGRVVYADIETTFELNSIYISSGYEEVTWEFEQMEGKCYCSRLYRLHFLVWLRIQQ